jgi:hypothetical protein
MNSSTKRKNKKERDNKNNDCNQNNTDNLFNFCFVYQLHFNRMKQNIDVYDFDFADTI